MFTLSEGNIPKSLFKNGYISSDMGKDMTPLHNEQYPNCEYLYFIPESYPFTISVSNDVLTRLRTGKDFIITGNTTFSASVRMDKSDKYDMFALLNVEGSDCTFSITY